MASLSEPQTPTEGPPGAVPNAVWSVMEKLAPALVFIVLLGCSAERLDLESTAPSCVFGERVRCECKTGQPNRELCFLSGKFGSCECTSVLSMKLADEEEARLEREKKQLEKAIERTNRLLKEHQRLQLDDRNMRAPVDDKGP